jgi:DEAD/DEAH box helicase domain-containing protein
LPAFSAPGSVKRTKGLNPFGKRGGPETNTEAAVENSFARTGFPDRVMPAKGIMKNLVYFDLETQKSADEVGGWGNIRDMKMSVGVTYSTQRGGYRIYGEKEVHELIEELLKADLVIGFNHLRFDYEVLHGYTVMDLRQAPTLDLMIELQKVLNHRLSLDSIATTTLGVEKTAEGLQAIDWFREGKMMEIAEYCCYDVKITKMVHEYGAAHKELFYMNRFGTRVTVPIVW